MRDICDTYNVMYGLNIRPDTIAGAVGSGRDVNVTTVLATLVKAARREGADDREATQDWRSRGYPHERLEALVLLEPPETAGDAPRLTNPATPASPASPASLSGGSPVPRFVFPATVEATPPGAAQPVQRWTLPCVLLPAADITRVLGGARAIGGRPVPLPSSAEEVDMWLVAADGSDAPMDGSARCRGVARFAQPHAARASPPTPRAGHSWRVVAAVPLAAPVRIRVPPQARADAVPLEPAPPVTALAAPVRPYHARGRRVEGATEAGPEKATKNRGNRGSPVRRLALEERETTAPSDGVVQSNNMFTFCLKQ